VAERRGLVAGILLGLLLPPRAIAGPPYLSDDPEPTKEGHFEIYAFTEGEHAASSTRGAAGIDFNYGAGPNLQLSATLPLGFAYPGARFGLANAALGAKYRFLHDSPSGGWDAAFFPQLSLPASADRFGDPHAALFLPIWFEHDADRWSTFGGGGCTINRGGDSRDFCEASWALARQVSRRLNLGGELAIASADSKGGSIEQRIGFGLRYDVDETFHFLAYSGTSIGAHREAGNASWYCALLSTF
jgi:hypothetical protein